jgi:acetyltransferase-like isoleucine patch superfamily enzyme
MRALVRYSINRVLPLLPDTRFYALKRRLLRLAGFAIGDGARITSSVRILGVCSVSIGKDTFVGHEVLITGGPSCISIGAFVDIAPRVTIVSGTHSIDPLGARSAGEGLARDIVIEDGVWIGAGTLVVAGVRIGRKAVIGAGSVVAHDIPPMCIAAGVPCKPVKFWNETSREWVRAPRS